MRYLSLFSGIEAASAAWQSLGWKAVAFSEIDPFCCKVLKAHYPNVPNLGDVRHINKENFNEQFDLLVGGSPCQNFSRSGNRQGLYGKDSWLAVEFIRIAKEYQPRWFLWENVPGALTSNSGEDFTVILYYLQKCGYGVAWRVLDAKYYGVPQSRKRLYLVGYYGDWRPSAAVLFDCKGSDRNFVEAQEEKPSDSATVDERTLLFDFHGQDASIRRFTEIAPTVTARYGTGGNNTPFTFCQTPAGEKLRALSPEEVEGLQGFAKGYTDIANGKTSKSQRYKALGNSMAVPVMQYLGQRIAQVEFLKRTV